MSGADFSAFHLTPYHDLTDFPARYAIQVNNCGVKQNYPSPLDIYRPRGRRDYSILYVSSGWIRVNHGDEIVRLNPNQGILYMPKAEQVNFFSPEGQPTVHYVYFTGTAISETVDQLDAQDSMLFQLENGATLRALFHQMAQRFRPLKALNGRKPINQPGINGLLLQILDVLLQSKETKNGGGSYLLLPAMNFITENFRQPITLEQCAATLNLSVGRFAHLFTEHYGISPYRFILSMRMDEATELLLDSTLSISKVAEQSGFSDPCYFSRLFRKYTGRTPNEYRSRRIAPPSGET